MLLKSIKEVTMKTSKKLSVNLFIKEITSLFNKMTKECEEFIISSTYNSKDVIIAYSKKEEKDV